MSDFLAHNLKKIRAVKQLNQKDFADLFGLSRANIGSYEEGRAHPKLEILVEIAKKFSINLEQLVNAQLSVNDILNFGEVGDSENDHYKRLANEENNAIVNVPFVSVKDSSLYISLGRTNVVLTVPSSFNADLAVELADTCLTDQSGRYQPGDVLLLNKALYDQINNAQVYAVIHHKKWSFGKLQRIENQLHLVPLNDLFPPVKVDPKTGKLWEVVYFLGKNRR
ncbi:MAG: LexA family transcriptional regulator [Flavobacteriales bacterium]|nr:LexA family transcriptional regulator [Flavobacteriales bacterium]